MHTEMIIQVKAFHSGIEVYQSYLHMAGKQFGTNARGWKCMPFTNMNEI